MVENGMIQTKGGQVMRLKYRFIWVILPMIALMGLALTGCNADRVILKGDQGIQDDESAAPPVKTPDVSETTEEGTASLYFSGNPYFSAELDTLLQDPEIQAAMDAVEAGGYVFSEEHSLVCEYEGSSGPGRQEYVILAMADADGAENIVAYIAAFLDGPKRIDAVEMAFGKFPPQSGYEYLVKNVWIRDYSGPISGKPLVSKPAWSWKRWFKCTLKTTARIAAGAAVGCAITGPAYGKCLAGAAAGGLVAGAVGCGLDQVLD
jgi:hypothetical protein